MTYIFSIYNVIKNSWQHDTTMLLTEKSLDKITFDPESKTLTMIVGAETTKDAIFRAETLVHDYFRKEFIKSNTLD